ncbi:hypothetical protein TNCT_545071 [Trichonephila clavata]|uniref:Uncharacterized protein n=1 Tax=Trichonephila clavata TaxID=2740835 RepID=A0A8X6L7Y3_TRICU|nr:hypothetical protein TNCT_545071 [Trichonephila clavata]
MARYDLAFIVLLRLKSRVVQEISRQQKVQNKKLSQASDHAKKGCHNYGEESCRVPFARPYIHAWTSYSGEKATSKINHCAGAVTRICDSSLHFLSHSSSSNCSAPTSPENIPNLIP